MCKNTWAFSEIECSQVCLICWLFYPFDMSCIYVNLARRPMCVHVVCAVYVCVIDAAIYDTLDKLAPETSWIDCVRSSDPEWGHMVTAKRAKWEEEGRKEIIAIGWIVWKIFRLENISCINSFFCLLLSTNVLWACRVPKCIVWC